MRQISLRTHFRRWVRGKKTLWTLNGLLFVVCLSLLLDTYWNGLRSSSISETWEGSNTVSSVMMGRNRAKPSQPVRKPRVMSGTYTRRRASKAQSTAGSQKKAGPAYCTVDQYANGTWEARAHPPRSLEDIRKLNSLSESGALGCHPIEWPIELKGEPAQDEPAHVDRLLQAAAYRWVPADDCKRRELAPSALIKRLLRSKGGMFIVGDSLTEQHAVIMRNLLVYPGGPWETVGYGDRPRFEGIMLNKNHPLTAGILRSAGVAASRCETPVVSMYLERHLISRDEMDEVMQGAEGYVPFSSGNGLEKWVSESIWYNEYLKVMTGPDVEVDPDIAIEENTVLVLNSGPHWVNYEFTTKDIDYYPQLLDGWENTIELLLKKVSNVPAAKQSVFWRATAPGHPHCELSTTAEARTDFRSTKDPEFMRYNWDLFEQLNSRWKKRLGAVPGGPGKDVATGMQYLDIWPMSVQRPDSHLLPPNDCLHYCYGLGGVVEEWQKFLWHTIASQSRNSDYHVDRPAFL